MIIILLYTQVTNTYCCGVMNSYHTVAVRTDAICFMATCGTGHDITVSPSSHCLVTDSCVDSMLQ